MNKKIIGFVIVIVIICLIGVGAFLLFNNKNLESGKINGTNPSDAINDENQNNESSSNTTVESKKVLVVYFSATGSTKDVAEKIANSLNADIFEIIPEERYTSGDLDWTNSNSRVSKEHDDESLRNVKLVTTEVENWDSYDTVLIGYPIWWGIAAWPVDTFVKANDFKDKTVIPFCTSASSGLGQSGKLLESIADGGTWLEGYRFSSNAEEKDIKAFIDNIK